jgi:nitroimidazol reductase NimA-like FMN-containing flavoprotein (pyridoxamine 5'-phosphate oxidase superfamily)
MSSKTSINRLPERGVEDREQIHAILDDALICHVGYVIDKRPVVIPTLYVRDGDRLLIHGSNTAGMVKAVRQGSPLCVTVTHLDGIVVARSGFHSSANYRSVVVHGTGRILEGEEGVTALDLIVDGLIPGRVANVRAPTTAETKQTSVFELSLDEVSAKVRTGEPQDDAEDLESDAWAGVIPLSVVAGEPEPSSDLRDGIPTPDYLRPYRS